MVDEEVVMGWSDGLSDFRIGVSDVLIIRVSLFIMFQRVWMARVFVVDVLALFMFN